MKLSKRLKSGLEYFVFDCKADTDTFTLYYTQWWKRPVVIKFTRSITNFNKKNNLYTYHMSEESYELWRELREYLGWEDVNGLFKDEDPIDIVVENEQDEKNLVDLVD